MTNNLPRQLQRQAEETARIEQEIAAANAQPDPAEPATPLVTPAVPDGPANTPQHPKTPDPVVQDDQWRQRYLTLDGKYKAEVPRLHADIKELKTQLNGILSRPVTPPSAPEVPRSKKVQVTDKDTEVYGAELLDLIKRQAEDIVSEREASLEDIAAKLRAENETLRLQVTGVSEKQAETATQGYLGRFAARVPDWETTNVDPDFLAWLSDTDPLSGLTRQAYLDDAANRMDVDRTVKLFETYRATKAPVTPNPSPRAASEIQRQVAPGKSKVTPATNPVSSDKIWTSQEVETFYVDMRRGAYRDTPDDAKRIENEIDLAVSQGRFR